MWGGYHHLGRLTAVHSCATNLETRSSGVGLGPVDHGAVGAPVSEVFRAAIDGDRPLRAVVQVVNDDLALGAEPPADRDMFAVG